MGLLTNIFYLISSALLIPCMLMLLWYVVRALLLMGQALRQYRSRCRQSNTFSQFREALEAGSTLLPKLPAEGTLAASLGGLCGVADNPLLAERLVRETELHWKSELELLQSLMRNGPAFGLMGTLIPLGPALVGLTTGDLQTLSSNLIIAFATTVVGLLVAFLAGTLLRIKRHWYQADAILLDYAAARLAQIALTDQLPTPHPQGFAYRSNGQKTAAAEKNGDSSCLSPQQQDLVAALPREEQ